MSIILASQSPRRRELLEMLGVPDLTIRPAKGPERATPGAGPEQTVRELALHKAQEVAQTCAPEDIIIARPGSGVMDGVVTSNVFIGVHYEMCIEAGGFEWLAQNTVSYPVGTQVSIDVLPENIQIMHKPVSAAQEVIKKNE